MPPRPCLLGLLARLQLFKVGCDDEKEGVFLDIREIILEKNKTHIAFGFEPENSHCIRLLYQVIFQAIKSHFLISMVVYLGVQKSQVSKPVEKCVQRSFVQKNIITIIITNMSVVMIRTVRCAIVSSRIN